VKKINFLLNKKLDLILKKMFSSLLAALMAASLLLNHSSVSALQDFNLISLIIQKSKNFLIKENSGSIQKEKLRIYENVLNESLRTKSNLQNKITRALFGACYKAEFIENLFNRNISSFYNLYYQQKECIKDYLITSILEKNIEDNFFALVLDISILCGLANYALRFNSCELEVGFMRSNQDLVDYILYLYQIIDNYPVID